MLSISLVLLEREKNKRFLETNMHDYNPSLVNEGELNIKRGYKNDKKETKWTMDGLQLFAVSSKRRSKERSNFIELERGEDYVN